MNFKRWLCFNCIQPIILSIMSFPKSIFDIIYVGKFMIVTFIISALYGFIMKFSKLFPILEETYYKRLEEDHGLLRSMYHDGISGLIVQLTIFMILLMMK